MTSPLGTYSFLPWLRQGLANEITAADGAAGVTLRPRVTVGLTLTGDRIGGGKATATVSREVELYGPGDVIGIDSRAIVRTEPGNWITNFEPNYLAHIEFYDEDFPWRYTPAAPANDRLRPWITLIVLTEDEFTDGKGIAQRPLPYIDLTDPGVLPRADELWAWAHVHVNRSLAANEAEFVSTDAAAVTARLATVLRENPDLAYSRLLCPRKLAPDTAYHAFLIPTFEAGRRAGLGLDLGDVAATMSAWDPGGRPEPASFPFYYRWFFRTGASGDFETLVRLLRPKPVDPRVGIRDMDVQFPGSAVSGVDNPELHGVLRLGGALRPPAKVPPEPPDVFERWDEPFPRPLQEDLARLINLPDDYQRRAEPDPVIAAPLYGRWHAMASRVLRDADGDLIAPAETWMQRLNLDPRFRVAVGLGIRVIQQNQEQYMNAAWQQVGDVLRAQRRIRFGQVAVQVSRVWHDRYLAAALASPQRALQLIAPVNRRLLADGVTLRNTMTTAYISPTMTTAALRRVIRPRGRLIRLLPVSAAHPAARLLERVNSGEVSAAPPKLPPSGMATSDEAAQRLLPTAVPTAVLDWFRRTRHLPLWTFLVAFGLAVVVLVFLGLLNPVLGVTLALLLAAAGVAASRALVRLRRRLLAADGIGEAGQTVRWLDQLPGASGFRVGTPATGRPGRPGRDSVEAARFKLALRDAFAMREAAMALGRPPSLRRLDLIRLASGSVHALDPSWTIPRRVAASVRLPERIRAEIGPGLVEPMAYPVIDQPMYEPLKGLGSELFLPNVNLIEVNSVTLLETNQRFIESYMVGLNYEFARELLWREYPTDQRGSPFRQFWDVRGFFNADNLDDEALKERLRDIPPLHRWSALSKLGTHDNREASGVQEDELVLVIRGELLKRYPTAVIYAHRARWQTKDDGSIDNTQERRFVELTPAEQANPPRNKVLTPLYEAKIDPDIYIFGFDLTVAKARGGTGANAGDDPGWFFVIKERPGEPRFGLDNERQPDLQVWNDLSWPDVQPAAAGSHLEIASSPASFTLTTPTGADSEKAPQHADDVNVNWSHAMTAADLAYILFQAPVLVGVHASEMLPR